MIHHKGRLDHVLLRVLLEEEIQDVALLVALLKLDAVLSRQRLGRLGVRHFVEIHARVLLDRIHHGNALEGLRQIQGVLPVSNDLAAGHFLCHIAVKILGQIHHAVIVGVGLVQLHQREFRIVPGVQSLVAEHAADLINPLHAAHDQALQVEFQGNSQLQILVQRVKVRLEGTGRRAAGVLHQHRRLHLHESLSVQIPANRADDPGTFDKGLLYLRVHDQIHVSLTIAGVRIRQAVILLRQNLQTLGEQRHFLRVNGDFSGFGRENGAADTENIAHIIFLKILVGILSHIVPRHIALNASGKILNITEGSFSHDTLEHHTSRDGNFLSLQLVVVIPDLLAVVGYIVLRDLKRILARLLQRGQLLPPHLKQLVHILLLRILLLSHISTSYLFLCLQHPSDPISPDVRCCALFSIPGRNAGSPESCNPDCPPLSQRLPSRLPYGQ